MGFEMEAVFGAMRERSYSKAVESMEEVINSYGNDFKGIIEACLTKISTIMHTEANTFWIQRLNGDGLVSPLVVKGGADISNIRLLRGEGFVGNVIKTGEAIIIEDCQNHPSFAKKVDDSTGFVTKTMICVPATVNGTTFGCLQLCNKTDDSFFDEKDLNLATQITNKIAEMLDAKGVLQAYFGYDISEINYDAGEMKKVASLFVSIAHFADIVKAAKAETIAELIDALQLYFGNCAKKHFGRLDKMMADRAELLFGLDYDNSNPAADAAKAALDILNNVGELNHLVETRFGIKFDFSIGISYGDCFVANIGFDHIKHKTAVGRSIYDASMIVLSAKAGKAYLSQDAYHKALEACNLKINEVPQIVSNNADVYDVLELKGFDK